MRIKFVALVPEGGISLEKDPEVRIRSSSTYKEVLLLTMKGAYGVPELVGIRYPPEHEEKAFAVHYGHDIRNQEEQVMEYDSKDSLVYKYSQLGFQQIGEFTVKDVRFAWKEFEGKYICIEELKTCFLELYRKFPGSDTNLFAEKQKRAWTFFKNLGIKKEQLLPMDYWGFLVMQMMQAAQQASGSTPQS